MRKKLFDKTLEFEINVVGYKNKGESIIFFLKTDGVAAYAGLVDCYEETAENEALTILAKENIKYLDFVCWTHPHEDHTLGMDKVLDSYCNEKTLFWMPPFISKDVEGCSTNAQEVYNIIFKILESQKRNKMKIREACDSKVLERFECCGNVSINPYIFEIRSFAPDTSLLGELKVRERLDMGNIYSIGLVINIGHYYIVLAGDVENRTIKCVPEFNFNIRERVDYIKIPHHSSLSADGLVDRFIELGIAAPSVATTTVYRAHQLPDKKVLKKYMKWGKNIEIYSTGDIENVGQDTEDNGIIKTTFDILEGKSIPIETFLLGNAVSIPEAL